MCGASAYSAASRAASDMFCRSLQTKGRSAYPAFDVLDLLAAIRGQECAGPKRRLGTSVSAYGLLPYPIVTLSLHCSIQQGRTPDTGPVQPARNSVLRVLPLLRIPAEPGAAAVPHRKGSRIQYLHMGRGSVMPGCREGLRQTRSMSGVLGHLRERDHAWTSNRHWHVLYQRGTDEESRGVV